MHGEQSMAITLTHGGPTMFTASAPSNEVLVGTLHGLVWLERHQGGWREARRKLEELHISAALFEPESGTLFATAFHGGIHASSDGGQSWEARCNGLDERDVYSLASTAQLGKPRLYAGTEPAEVFISDDLGASWSRSPTLRQVDSVPRWTFPGPPHVAHVKHINFDPRHASVVYASIEQGALLKSTDAGETWADVPGMDDDVHRTVIHPNGQRILITGGAGIYASEDEGASWEHRTFSDDDVIGGYPDQLVFRPSHPDTMVVASAHRSPFQRLTSKFARSRISKSEDGGRTWRPLQGGLPDLKGNVEAMCLEDWDGGFSLFAATTSGEVLAWDDGGDKWSTIARELGPVSKGDHYKLLQ